MIVEYTNNRVWLSNFGLYFFTPKVLSDANFISNLWTDLAETLSDFELRVW